jgi:hypothetical protein
MIRRIQFLLLLVILALPGLAGEAWGHGVRHRPPSPVEPSAESGASWTDPAGALPSPASPRGVVPAAAVRIAESVSDLVGGPRGAQGRGTPRESAWSFPGKPEQGLTAVAVALGALALGLIFRRSRRGLALALGLLLGLLAFETALHSVHHPPNSDEAAACAFASAAAHLAAADTGERAPTLLLPPAPVDGLHADPAPAAARAHLASRGRAPPAPLA